MKPTLDVLLSPAEYQARRAVDFAGSVCVVFDVLRATSVMVTGLAHGATGFLPATEISEALGLRGHYPNALLAGERNGLRITAAQSGTVDFDLGNSPREYESARIDGRLIITTTTNGTRALRCCSNAQAILAAAFLNLHATADWIQRHHPLRVQLICAGTGEAAALEDILAAGALAELLADFQLTDAAQTATSAYRAASRNLGQAINRSQNGSRLLANPELQADVAFCLQRDKFPIVARLSADGVLRITD